MTELRAELAAMDRAVGQLVDPIVVRVQVRGQLVDRGVPSLLEQIRELVAGSTSGKGGGSGRAHSPVPIDPGALDLVEEIDRMAREELWREKPAEFFVGQRLAARAPARELSTAQRIRNTAKFVRGAATEAWHVVWLTELLEGWVARARDQVDPARRLQVPCPACGVLFVERPNAAGEEVRTFAVVIRASGQAECEACEHRWSGVRTLDVERQIAEALGGAA